MAEPDTLLIPYEDFESGRFTHVGRYGGGNQFMGYVTFASQYVPKFYHTEEVTADGRLLFRQHTNCFAVLHPFDAAGRHLGTDVERVEGTPDSGQRDWAKLEEMIAGLGVVEFGDIRVKLFRVEVGKVVHGLIYEPEGWEEGYQVGDYVMLEPNDIMFHPPWDSGEYSTRGTAGRGAAPDRGRRWFRAVYCLSNGPGS
jgi:formate hydrogenlyase regulatory protein HycA